MTITTKTIAGAVRRSLDADSTVPADTVQVEVADRAVTLRGAVDTNAQRLTAIRDTERITGVEYVLDRTGGITMSVSGTVVTLSGTVRTFAEKHEAELAAWRSPHVMDVVDRLVTWP